MVRGLGGQPLGNILQLDPGLRTPGLKGEPAATGLADHYKARTQNRFVHPGQHLKGFKESGIGHRDCCVDMHRTYRAQHGEYCRIRAPKQT